MYFTFLLHYAKQSDSATYAPPTGWSTTISAPASNPNGTIAANNFGIFALNELTMHRTRRQHALCPHINIWL